MGDEGDYWRDVKAYSQKQKDRYERSISRVLQKLIDHEKCKKVGDHYRIGDWDFWLTGTVMNIKTKEHIGIYALYEKFNK